MLQQKCGILAVTITFASVIAVSSAIMCYQCNSEYDPRCGDPFDSYSLGQVNCSMKEQLEHLPGLSPSICRKTTQKIFGKMRVVRDCGYLTDEKDKDRVCLKRSGTFEVQTHFCSCTDDLCNAAERPASTPLLWIGASVAAAAGVSQQLTGVIANVLLAPQWLQRIATGSQLFKNRS